MNKITNGIIVTITVFILAGFSFTQEILTDDKQGNTNLGETRFDKSEKTNAVEEKMLQIAEQPIQKTEDSEVFPKADSKNKVNKYEIGFQVTWHYQESFNKNSPVFSVVSGVTGPVRFPSTCCQTEFGFGGRFTYNFNRNFALEIESNFFPVDRLNPRSREGIRIFGTDDFIRVSVEPQGRKIQAFTGPKIGIRKERFGIFGKVRPGMYWVLQYPRVFVLIPNPPAAIFSGKDWVGFFAVDVGAVFEYYPTKKTVIRFDVGDTIVNYRALNPKPFNPGFIRHTFQFTTGFGFRF